MNAMSLLPSFLIPHFPAYYTLADVLGWFNQNYDPEEEG